MLALCGCAAVVTGNKKGAQQNRIDANIFAVCADRYTQYVLGRRHLAARHQQQEQYFEDRWCDMGKIEAARRRGLYKSIAAGQAHLGPKRGASLAKPGRRALRSKISLATDRGHCVDLVTRNRDRSSQARADQAERCPEQLWARIVFNE